MQTNTELQQQLHSQRAASYKRGELYFQGDGGFCCFGGDGWQQRFVQIRIKGDSKQLKIFEQKAHAYARGKNQALASCEIEDCQETKTSHNGTNGFGFIIKGKNKQDYFLSTDFEEERQTWIEFIVMCFVLLF